MDALLRLFNSLIGNVPAQAQTTPQKPFDQKMAEKGWSKRPDGSYFRSDSQQTPAPIQPAVENIQAMQRSNDSPIPENIRQIADPIFAQYEIPPQIGYGQFAAEGRGKQKYAQDPYNNPYDIGAFDSNPDAAVRYPTLAKGIEAYAKLMSGNYQLGYVGSGNYDKKYSPAYQLRNDPEAMLKKIGEIGYASNPDYIKTIKDTPEYQYYSMKRTQGR